MWRWCFRYRRTLLGFSSLGSAVVGGYTLYYGRTSPDLKNIITYAPVSLVLNGAHVVMILVLLCRQVRRREVPATYQWKPDIDQKYWRLDLAQISVGQFQWWWSVALVAWLLLYIVQVASDVATLRTVDQTVAGRHVTLQPAIDRIQADVSRIETMVSRARRDDVDVLRFLCGSINSAALFAMWAVLSRITVNKDGRDNDKWWWLYAVSAAFIGTILYAFLLHSDWPTLQRWGQALGKVAEMAGAVILVGLIGKLDNPVIGAPRFVIMALYFYAVLAASYDPAYRGTPLWMFQVALALPLKIVMYCFIEWAIGSGVLLFYVRRERQEIEEGMSAQADFLCRLPYTPEQLRIELISRKRLISCRTAFLFLLGRDCPRDVAVIWDSLVESFQQSGQQYWRGHVASLSLLVIDPDSGSPRPASLDERKMSVDTWRQLFGEWGVWSPFNETEHVGHLAEPIRSKCIID